jgi:hypothetical protein
MPTRWRGQAHRRRPFDRVIEFGGVVDSVCNAVGVQRGIAVAEISLHPLQG